MADLNRVQTREDLQASLGDVKEIIWEMHSSGNWEIKKVEITQLPEECISHIISFTSPRDACRLSLVCPLFRSAIDSDVVWRKFLPHDYHQILSNSAFASSMDPLSKKQLFLHLSDNSIIIDSDKNMLKTFTVDVFCAFVNLCVDSISHGLAASLEWLNSGFVLRPSKDKQELCKVREDGLLEVEIGEFFNDGGEDHQMVVCIIMETVIS
ncbi:hypothetical protein FEM48_Zijuj07G0071400 [Ziziphus jujuba var. spinosa]|uniref:F-box domain-containing protein n=1 Tax=Ziziphus jujuba var. spinosa TaxID=714518 RepID=A0A978V374_ZIZJJ|nr:hypothetical protein FEM48_Zijuj07G0071400 [Ziziphus jujuba var. spinosa]